MCDCEELEFEDFEVMLSAISKRSAAPVAEAPAPVPQWLSQSSASSRFDAPHASFVAPATMSIGITESE